MTIQDSIVYANALKIRQARRMRIAEQKASKLIAWMPHTYNFTGISRHIVARINPNAGGGNTFLGAVNNKRGQRYIRFNVTRGSIYGIGEIDHQLIQASRDQEGGVVKALDDSLDAANKGFFRRLSHQLWGNHGGARAQVSSVLGNVVTLVDPRTTIKFEVDQLLEASSTNGLTGSLYNGTAVVTAVSNTGGTITLDDATALNPGTGLAANDYLFGWDEFGSSLYGIDDWIPATDPTTGDNFFSVDRSVHPTRLAGYRETRTEEIEAALISFVGNARQYGAEFDTLWLNSVRFTELQKSFNAAKDVTVDIKDSSGRLVFSYDTIGLRCSGRVIPIMDDPDCPYRYCFGLTRDSWELAALGQIPHFAEDDGRNLQRSANADASEYRLRAWLQPICEDPYANGRLDLLS